MNRKYIILFSAMFVFCCIASGYIGYKQGSQKAVTARFFFVVESLDVLQKVKAGDLAGATSRLEGVCFANSLAVLSESSWRSDAFRKIEVPPLKEYRAKYRTNQADWSVTEHLLQVYLEQKP